MFVVKKSIEDVDYSQIVKGFECEAYKFGLHSVSRENFEQVVMCEKLV